MRATLTAYVRYGYRRLFERHLDLAARLAALVDAAPDLELLAEPKLSVVCFRFNPGGEDEDGLNRLNEALGRRIFEDGRFAAGTTDYGGRIALRPTLVNWRTEPEHVEDFVRVVRELAADLDV